MKWSKAELKRLEKIAASKSDSVTEYELAGRLSGQFKGKSAESIRWQLRQMRRELQETAPLKILVVDIETLPIEALVWGTKKQYISPVQIKKDWSMLSWSARWLFDKKTDGQVVTPKEAINRTDESIVLGLWEKMNEANVVISYNGNGFDFKRMNTRFLLNNLPKPMYSKSVDLYQTVVQNFAFTKNSMDYVNAVLGIGRKIGTNFGWWAECANGNKEYLKKMLEYNLHDVKVTEELYMKLRPWIDGLNLSVFAGDGDVPHCPACVSTNLNWNGTYTTPLGRYEAFRCQDCGAIGRSTRKLYKIAGSVVRN